MRLSIIVFLLLLAGCDSADELTSVLSEPEPEVVIDGKGLYDEYCWRCHEGQVPKAPHREMIGLATPESILVSMRGIMAPQSEGLSDEEQIRIAEYLTGKTVGLEVLNPEIPACTESKVFNARRPIAGANWGIQPTNTRHLTFNTSGIDSRNVHKLREKWAVSFPDANRVRSQPVFAGGLIFVGSHGGKVYALDEDTGCSVWTFQAAGEVRTGIVATFKQLYFGDVLGNVYSISTITGEQTWRMRADDHPNATITGTPTLHKETLYVPVSALEVSLAVDPEYECCTFRGSVVAVNAATGEVNWKTYTIDEPATVQGQNPVGTNIMGPSGAMIWNSPAIDTENNQLLVGTGENMSSPATRTSDAIIAMDLTTGAINWTYQATRNDVWNTACDTDTPENCPVEGGPDFDFGGAAVVVDTKRHGRLVIAGQKSGYVHALQADTGKRVWRTQVGRGGIQGGIHFGIAVAYDKVLVPISDWEDGRSYPTPSKPGMHALDANTGDIIWSRLHENNCGEREYCDPGISQVPTVIGNLVFAGAMDGMARAYDIETGRIRWEIDTTGAFPTAGLPTNGGSMGGGAGPVAYDGTLLLSSGYGIYMHMPGNLLLALTTDDPPKE